MAVGRPLAVTPADLRSALVVALAIALVLIAFMPATMLWDRDETLYARTAVEMLQSGDWLVPTYNGATFAHKPPLIYWLMAASLGLFGHGEFAVRLPSAFGMAGAAFMTFLIGARLFGPRAGLWSMAILATSAMAIYLGAAAMLDAVLLFFITLAVWAFVELVCVPRRAPVMIPLFGAALALAQLTKGPVGPAVVVSMVLLTCLLLPRSERPRFALLAALAFSAIVSFVIFLLWAIPANNASGGAMWETGIALHVIGRALRPMEGHGGSGIVGYLATLPIYVPVIVFGIFPWLIHLPTAASALLRREIGARRDRAILWGWAAPTFLMFTFAATKLPHYIFPLFPAVAIAIAATVDARQRGGLGDRTRWWLRAGAWVYGGSIVAMLLALAAGIVVAPDLAPPARIVPFAVFVGIAAWFVVRAQAAEKVRASSLALIAAAPIAFGFLYWIVVPGAEPSIKISRAVAELVRANAGPDTRLFMKGYDEPSLVFYLDRPVGSVVRTLGDDPAENARLFAEAETMVLVTDAHGFAALEPLAGDRPFRVLGRWDANNLNSGGRREAVIVAARGLAPGG